MEFIESYITDQEGKVKAVILKYDTYKKIEELLLDIGLAKSMEEIMDEEEIDLKEAISFYERLKNENQI